MWVKILSFILNPHTLITLLTIGFIAFVAFTFQENKNLKHDLAGKQAEIVQLHKDVTKLDKFITIHKDDIERIDEIAKYKQTVIVKEHELDRSLENVPTTLHDAPFSDPNNLNYAGQLRSYQLDTLKSLDSTGQHN